MTRYAWKTTGVDGSEATGTFALSSVNLVAVTAKVDVDGALVADGRGGYAGGFGSDHFCDASRPGESEGDKVPLESRGDAILFVNITGNRVSIRILNLTGNIPLNDRGVERLRLALNKVIEDQDPADIVEASSEDESEQA